MNKKYIFFLLWLCHAALYAQLGGSGGDYDPSNPPNPVTPETKYVLTTSVTPANSGSTNLSSAQSYAVGADVYIRAYGNTGFVFQRWMEGDSLISTTPSFYYTMPARNVNLRAEYKYDPSSPANPEAMGVSYNLNLVASPANGGSFNQDSRKVEEGTETSLYAYTNTGYEFVGWQLNGQILSTDQQFYYTMPNKNTTLTAVFKYNPTSPANPGANSWTEATGEVIADDFLTGYLYNAIYNLTGGNNDAVTQITVVGKMNYNDFSIANNYGNCTHLDLSRTTGLSSVPSYSYNYNSTLTSIVLPASISELEYYAFYQCENLAEISCYAPVPPTVGWYALTGVQDGCVVYVPAGSVSLYQEAEGWKDFTILPLADEVNALEVNLPGDAEDGRYKNMYLELVNTKSGQKLRYVVSDRLVYTFNSLMHNTQWNVYLKNAQDVVLGEIDDIDIQTEDVSVTFTDVLTPRNLKLSVLTPTGADVTAQTGITWLDAKDTYLTQGNTLAGQTDSTEVKYRVSLPQALAMEYILPTEQTYKVAGVSDITLQLQALPQTTLSGVVRDITTEQPIAGATISISQALNGLYSKAQNVKTDASGKFTATIYDTQYAPLQLTVSAADYISKSVAQDQLTTDDDLLSADVTLKAISGATISVGFTYTASAAAGTEAETQNWYSDYANVSYTVYNETQQRDITEFSAQYPQIVLLEEVNEGDVLRLTATSRTAAFVPVTTTATIDEANRASATFDIVQLGQIAATFTTTENAAVVGILYDARGKLVKSKAYTNAQLSFPELADGDYTLVSMAKSNLFNSVYDLAQLPATGLTEGTDYVQNSVTVKTGVITAINNDLVPYLDESKLYYTGDNTSFSVNKTQVTAGNYLTLTGRVDFKAAYANGVSNVKLIVDLPEESSLVDNSVMVGTVASNYVSEGHRITIPMDNYAERVRFCFIPTAGGDYAPSAYVQFTFNGEEVTQPIGSATYTVKDLSISVPSTVAKTSVPVSGTAIGKSTIELYDNGTLVGQTTALANGSFATTIELDSPYNLSTHEIYAKVTTPMGVEMQTESQTLTYDKNAIEVKTVTMSFYNGWLKKNVEVVFDFEKGTTSDASYMFYTGTDITFVADFTDNDTTIVRDVTIFVFTDQNEVRELEATYNAKTNRWIAVSRFESNNLPINISVDYNTITKQYYDATQIEDAKLEIEKISSDYFDESQKLKSLFEEYPDAISDEEYRIICSALGIEYDNIETEDETDEDFSDWSEEEMEAYLNKRADEMEQEYEVLLQNIADCDKWFELPKQFSETFGDGATYSIGDCSGLTPEMLQEAGYETLETTEGYSLYLLTSDKEVTMVNFNDDLRISIVMPNSAQASIRKGMHKAPIPDQFAEVYGWIKEARELVNTIYDDFLKRLMLPEQKLNDQISSLQKHIAKCERYLRMCKEGSDNYKKWNKNIKNAKKTLATTRTVLKYTKPLLKFLARCVPVADYLVTLNNCWSISTELSTIYASIPDPCENDQANANWCKAEDISILLTVGTLAITDVIAEVTADVEIAGGAATSIATGGTSLAVTGWGIVQKVAAQVGKLGISLIAEKVGIKHLRNKVAKLACKKKDPKNPPTPPFKPISPIHDPSGYVYEGVSSNRLQGVTATAYYKETVEDMYGDLHENIVLWDAAEYAQENPLFTDEYGMYQWDVPQGLWQVKFEKEGYQTTYSEWLPVPPPQLDVNIAMVQDRQPEVTDAHAYEDGVEVDFDKYMQPEYLTTDNIIVTKNGEKMEGSIELIDEENAYEGDATTYASRVKFVPANEEPILSTDAIVLTVSSKVRSYAGLQMQESYTQEFDVEKAVRKIVVDSLVTIAYEGERQLLVSAQPADAAVGKVLTVKTVSKMITDVFAGEETTDETGTLQVVLDEEGQATIKLTGELPGTTVVSFSIADANVTAQTAATVTDKPILDTPAPIASRASGSAVYRGTAITLSSETEGATIYYTLDGSCPCEEATRLTYDGTPIVINEGMTIRAIAQGKDMYESEVAAFTYTIKQTTSGISLKEGWNWVSHNVAEAQDAATAFANANEVKSQTKGLIKDANFGLTGNLQELLATEAYKVKAGAAESIILKGEEFNAGANGIDVKKGWNWIGYPVNQTMALGEALAKSQPADGDQIVGQSGYAEFVDDEWLGSLEVLTPGQGYMYQSADDNSILYNTSVVSLAKSRYGHSTVSRLTAPWAVNIYQYPDVMPVTADLFVDGTKAEADAYSIGAFSGTECRGVGKYVKGVLFLSVYGEGNEKITFLAANNETDDLYDISESLTFSADNVGSYRAPFALHMGDKATEIASLNAQLGVSPAIARDVITVTLPAAQIERLAVISMGGTPVIQTANLEVPAQVNVASLPEGAYIVAVTSGGRTYYKKIIKVN